MRRHIQSWELMTEEYRCCVELTNDDHLRDKVSFGFVVNALVNDIKHADTYNTYMEQMDNEVNCDVNEEQFHDCVEVVKWQVVQVDHDIFLFVSELH